MGNVSSGDEEVEEEAGALDLLGLPESLKTNTNQNNTAFKFFRETVCEQYPDEAKHLLSQADSLQCLPIHHAIAAGDFATVVFLLEKSVQLGLGELSELINRSIVNEATALHLGVTSGNLTLVQYLLEHGAKKNVATSVGATPLHVACVCGSDRSEAGSIEMVKLLVTEENLNKLTTANESPLFLVLNHYSTDATSIKLNEEIADFLLSQPLITLQTCQPSLLSLACGKGYVNAFNILLERQNAETEADFEAPGGLHCIHLAASCGSSAIVSTLLDRGVAVDLATKKKETPLLQAIVKLLVEKGADLNYVCNGTPILSYASGKGKTEITAYLLEKGADPSKKDKHKNTPLHLAACEGNYHEIVELLLTKLNNVNEKNGKGRTPLYLACDRSSNEKTVETLLKFGANVNDISPKGATGSVAAIRLLLQAGADASMYTNDGKLALQFALELGSKDSAALLLSKAKLHDVPYLRAMVLLTQKASPHVTSLILDRIDELLQTPK